MSAASAAGRPVTRAALPARNPWAAVAILLNLISSSALPSVRSPEGPQAAVATHAQAAALPGRRGGCGPGLPCAMGRMADPAPSLTIRPPSRTRSWRYRAVFA